MGKRFEKVFKKNSLKQNAVSHNNASWNSDTNGFPEHSPSRGSLYYKGPAFQKIILGLFFGSSLINVHRSAPNIFLLADIPEFHFFLFLKSINST